MFSNQSCSFIVADGYRRSTLKALFPVEQVEPRVAALSSM